jgi:hypothetical protein
MRNNKGEGKDINRSAVHTRTMKYEDKIMGKIPL